MSTATQINTAAKTLSTYDASKSLGGQVRSSGNQATAGQDMGAWLEEAYAYREWLLAIVEGRIQPSSSDLQDLPSDPTAFLNELDNQIRWTLGQMGAGASWDPVAGGSAAGETTEADAFGGITGTMGNLIHNEEQARIGFTGSETRDIWSDDVVIDVAPLSAVITSETTTDTRWQPPENVLKITVKDPATGQEAVYFVHDYENAHIKVRSPREAQLTDFTDAADAGLVTWEKFTPAIARTAGGSESDIPGVQQPDGSLLYDVPAGRSVSFQAQGSGVSGEVQRHDIYGNADITVLGSDEVTVTKNRNVLTGEEPGTYRVTVRHRDGSSDEYTIHAELGFTANLNANPRQITWEEPKNLLTGYRPISPSILGSLPTNGTPTDDTRSSNEDAGIPETFAETFTLNGNSTAEGVRAWQTGAPVNSSDAGLTDTAPSRIDETGSSRKAIYDNPADDKIEIHTSFEDEVNEHHISTAGSVDIFTESNTDKVFIKKVNGTYTVIVYKQGITDPNDPNYRTETFVIEGNPSTINVHALPSNVRQYVFGQYSWTQANNPVDTYDEGSAYTAGSVAKVKVSNEGPAWPGDEIIGSIPTGGDSAPEAVALMQKINEAIRNGEWHEVTGYLSTLGAGTANNVVRKIITAIYEAAATDSAFLELMQKIPFSVRNQMKDTLSFEPDEIQAGDAFNSAATAEKISVTLEY